MGWWGPLAKFITLFLSERRLCRRRSCNFFLCFLRTEHRKHNFNREGESSFIFQHADDDDNNTFFFSLFFFSPQHFPPLLQDLRVTSEDRNPNCSWSGEDLRRSSGGGGGEKGCVGTSPGVSRPQRDKKKDEEGGSHVSFSEGALVCAWKGRSRDFNLATLTASLQPQPHS